jgi:hypothetical protein
MSDLFDRSLKDLTDLAVEPWMVLILRVRMEPYNNGERDVDAKCYEGELSKVSHAFEL